VLASQENRNDSPVLPPGQGGPQPQKVLELNCDYPIVCGESGESLEFDIKMDWKGEERQRFDLSVTTPPDWRAIIFSQRPDEKPIAALELDPRQSFRNGVKIVVAPLPGKLPDAGDYAITFEVSWEGGSETIELTARVTPRYEFAMVTQSRRLTTNVTAGEDNHLAVVLVNSGSASIENLALTSTQPEGWAITYEPGEIDSLAPGTTQDVDVIITPPKETAAGDWPVTLRAENEQVRDELELRVTVLTSSIGGWIVVLIVVVVIAGAGVALWWLGRR